MLSSQPSHPFIPSQILILFFFNCIFPFFVHCIFRFFFWGGGTLLLMTYPKDGTLSLNYISRPLTLRVSSKVSNEYSSIDTVQGYPRIQRMTLFEKNSLYYNGWVRPALYTGWRTKRTKKNLCTKRYTYSESKYKLKHSHRILKESNPLSARITLWYSILFLESAVSSIVSKRFLETWNSLRELGAWLNY